jgi:hypothetical protein
MSDMTQLLMASLISRMQRDDVEREERREAAQMQQQLNMTMMMAMVSALNPAASSLLASNLASIVPQAGVQDNHQAHEEETSYNNQED